MSSTFDKLNLKPGEKRLLVGIGIVVFIVLNSMFVFPRFGELGRLRGETEDIQNTVERFQVTIDKKGIYQKMLSELEQQGSVVIDQEQALRLQMAVQSQAIQSGVNITRYDPVNRASGATNAFFDEQSIVVNYETGYRQLIDFLVRLAEHESMIRVRNLGVRPETSQQRLQGTITLVASYQKSGKSGTAAAAPAPTSTASTP